MQTILINKTALFSAAVTRAMLLELAVTCKFYTAEAAEAMADATLSKPSKLLSTLECPKLRTILDQKLTQSSDDEYGQLYKSDQFNFDFMCLADIELDIGSAGKNSGTRSSTSKLTGNYEVVKVHASNDEGKDAIWSHIWTCTSFEEFFKAAPAKGFTSKTNRAISASSEIGWALKSKWIKRAA